MSLAIEQYGTIVMVEKVFQRRYMITIHAMSPALLSAEMMPHSSTGRKRRNIPMMSRMPPKNI